jgi:signal transduction histidine kinase
MVLLKNAKNPLQTDNTLLTEGHEYVNAVNKLRRSEAYLAETQKMTHTGSWAFTPGREGWNYWSDETFRIFECDPQQEPPTHEAMLQLTHPDDRQHVLDRYGKALREKVEYIADFRSLFPDGHVKYLHAIGHPVFDDAGEIVEFVGTIIDLTEQRQKDEALRRNEAYLADSQRMAHLGSWAWDPIADSWSYWSEEMFRIFEFDPGQGLPMVEMSRERIHPEDRAQVSEKARITLRDKEEYVNDYRLQFPNGRLKYLHVIGHPVLDDAGEIAEFVGTSVDVTERKRADEALRRSEAYLAEAQRLSHTGSWALDPFTGKITYYSEEMFRIMGFDPALGLPDREALSQRAHPDDLPRIIEGMERIIAASRKSRMVTDQTTNSPTFEALVNELRAPTSAVGDDFELRVVLPDETLRYVRSYGHPVFDKTGQLTEFVGTAVDVTEQKKVESERERLRQLEADLAHLNRISMLGELTASISHELKQPLTAGITSAQTTLRWLTKDQPDIENACQSATNALKAGERAVEIIQRLRSLYTKAPPRWELLDGNKIIGELVEMLRAEADRSGVSIKTDFTAKVPMIRSERVQLQQVLMNLMLNAIEAMKETGGSLSVKSALNQEGLLQISVSDTGPGLPPTKEEQIFEPFFTTKPQGSGMGLAICRSIIESQGGRLWASANRECGVSFHFALPTVDDAENGTAVEA